MIEGAYSVLQFNNYVKAIFDNEDLLKNIKIYGEVSGLTSRLGHAYFTLKDEDASIPCVFFGGGNNNEIKDGMQLLVYGSPNFYVKGGKLSFNVRKVEQYGIGKLYEQFLMVKQKLQTEGLFDESHKKPLPYFVKNIGVVTAETGAVIHDIINITTRRNNSVNIILYPVKVQGIGADKEIADGINYFSKSNVDAIIVGRGGGSFEDLLPFSSEIVARAAYNCVVPLVSAVGHETDFSLLDFVADKRAPTPSAAAELLVIDKNKEKDKIKYYVASAYSSLIKIQKINQNAVLSGVNNLYMLSQSFCDKNANKITSILQKCEMSMFDKLNIMSSKLEVLKSSTEKLNPKSILNSGYSIVEVNSKRITSVNDLQINENMVTYFSNGRVSSNINKIEIEGE